MVEPTHYPLAFCRALLGKTVGQLGGDQPSAVAHQMEDNQEEHVGQHVKDAHG